MIDAVDRLIAERQTMDQGLSVGLTTAVVGHVLVVLACIVLPALLPKPQLIRPQTAFAVILPRGGGGSPKVEEAAAPQPRPEPKAAEQVAPPPKIVKPPHEEKRQGLAPPPDLQKTHSRLRTGCPVPMAHSSGSVLPA